MESLSTEEIAMFEAMLLGRLTTMSNRQVNRLAEMKRSPLSHRSKEIAHWAFLNNNFGLTGWPQARYDELIRKFEMGVWVKSLAIKVARERGILDLAKFPSLQ